jgi:hypothetical protein
MRSSRPMFAGAQWLVCGKGVWCVRFVRLWRWTMVNAARGKLEVVDSVFTVEGELRCILWFSATA